jgi:hypothetical protein
MLLELGVADGLPVFLEKRFQGIDGVNSEGQFHHLVVLIALDGHIRLALVGLPEKNDERRQKLIRNLPYRGVQNLVNGGTIEYIGRPGEQALVIANFLIQFINIFEDPNTLKQGIIFDNLGI